MKRSDAISTILIVLNSNYGMNNSINEEVADMILSFQELDGMLPPDVDKVIEGHLCTVNKWEPEDEDRR